MLRDDGMSKEKLAASVRLPLIKSQYDAPMFLVRVREDRLVGTECDPSIAMVS